MPVTLPFPDQDASRQQITLENVPYSMLLTWNERAGAWVFGLEDRDNQPVILGRRVVLQLDLLSGYHHLPGMPSGVVVALDHTGQATAIAHDDLISGSIALLYFTRDEIDAL